MVTHSALKFQKSHAFKNFQLCLNAGWWKSSFVFTVAKKQPTKMLKFHEDYMASETTIDRIGTECPTDDSCLKHEEFYSCTRTTVLNGNFAII
jgi:hypothetical protein